MDGIIICGGLGTRIKSISDGQPKALLPINTKPFLYYLLNKMQSININKIYLALGFGSVHIIEYINNNHQNHTIFFSIESEPLGTGGAVKLVLDKYPEISNPFFVLNGDTLVDFELANFVDNMNSTQSVGVIGLQFLKDCSRYGRVEIDKSNFILSFKEKAKGTTGFINAGVYLLDKHLFDNVPVNEFISIEKDIFSKNGNNNLSGVELNSEYFIDIGVPEDYHRLVKNIEEFIS